MRPNKTYFDYIRYEEYDNSPLDLRKKKNKKPYQKVSSRKHIEKGTAGEQIVDNESKRKFDFARRCISQNRLIGPLTSAVIYKLWMTYLLICQAVNEQPLCQSEIVNLLETEFNTDEIEKSSDSESSQSSNSSDSSDSGIGSCYSDYNGCTIPDDMEQSLREKSEQENFKDERGIDSKSDDSGMESNDQDNKKQSSDDDDYSVHQSNNECDDAQTESKDNKSPINNAGSDTSTEMKQKPESQNDAKTLLTNDMKSFLNIKEFRDCQCYDDASNIIRIFLDVLQDDNLDVYFKTFVHSFTCTMKECTILCFMFKRILVHVTDPKKHSCAVEHVYRNVLKMHLDTCKQHDCLLPNCLQLQKNRSTKSHSIDSNESGIGSSDSIYNEDMTVDDLKCSLEEESEQAIFKKEKHVDSTSSDSGIESNGQDSEKQTSDEDDDDSVHPSDNEGDEPLLVVDEKIIPEDNKSSILPVKSDPSKLEDENDESAGVREVQALAQNIVKKLMTNNIKSFLNIKEFRDCQCYGDASNIIRIFITMLKNNNFGTFLNEFVHSFTCQTKECSKLCFMFKRILVHITGQKQHTCAVKHVYCNVLKMHLDTCKKQDCLMPNCGQLQEKRRLVSTQYSPSPENI